jgi:hypothetical protein
VQLSTASEPVELGPCQILDIIIIAIQDVYFFVWIQTSKGGQTASALGQSLTNWTDSYLNVCFPAWEAGNVSLRDTCDDAF